jgi:cation diffusion facilitator family transporter
MNSKKGKDYFALLSIWISIIGNTILFGLKLWAGLMVGSVAVIADAWHTLSDSVSSIIVFIGVKISQKKPDKEHPFGYGKADTIAQGILSVLLSVIAFEFLLKGIGKIVNHSTATYNIWVVYVFVISIIVKETMARISIWAEKKSGKKSLKADAWHHRSDAIASLMIIIGVFLNKYWWWIDGAMGIIVAIIIFVTSIEIMKDVANSIIGKSPDEQQLQEIKDFVNKTVGFELYPHHIHIHEYGHHRELTLHIYLQKDTPLQKAHEITVLLDNQFQKEKQIISTIHVEPLPDSNT